MDKLFEQCKSKNKTIEKVEEGGHNNSYLVLEDYYPKLTSFLNSVSLKESS